MRLIRLNDTEFKHYFIYALKFALVGMAGLLIDFTVTWAMKDALNINAYVANASGFVLAASANFYLNKKWTFNDGNPQVFKQYLRFFLISLFGLLLNTLLLYLLYGYWGWLFYPSKLMAVVVVFFWNFFANNFFTFRSKTGWIGIQ